MVCFLLLLYKMTLNFRDDFFGSKSLSYVCRYTVYIIPSDIYFCEIRLYFAYLMAVSYLRIFLLLKHFVQDVCVCPHTNRLTCLTVCGLLRMEDFLIKNFHSIYLCTPSYVFL